MKTKKPNWLKGPEKYFKDVFDEPSEEIWDNVFLYHQYQHPQEEEKYALLRLRY